MSNLVRWDPISELGALQKQFFGDNWMTSLKGVNIPTTDVYVKDNQLTVEAHLPNFQPADVGVEVENNALVISAERHEKEEDKNKDYVVRESSSSFYRRIPLPERADADKTAATIEDGVLTVSVPLEPLPEPKKISVTDSSNKKQ